MARIVIVACFVGIIGGVSSLAWHGVWGESSSVVSTRVGSGGGGYGSGGRVK